MLRTSPSESASYRVTLFFGPDPVDGRAGIQACVFNVKKRSWKAGVQVSVEVDLKQLAAIRQSLHVTERLAQALESMDRENRSSYEARGVDCFVQAVCRCKLDLRLNAGLAQENQCIPSSELEAELTQSVLDRREYVFSYIFTELDLMPHPSPSSSS